MKPGTFIRLPDGREATVVYHGLTGYGVRFGRLRLSAAEIEAIYNGDGDTIRVTVPEGFELMPEAMLRDPYQRASLPCIGTEYEIIE